MAVTKLLRATRGVRRVALQEGEFAFEIKAGFVNWGKGNVNLNGDHKERNV